MTGGGAMTPAVPRVCPGCPSAVTAAIFPCDPMGTKQWDSETSQRVLQCATWRLSPRGGGAAPVASIGTESLEGAPAVESKEMALMPRTRVGCLDPDARQACSAGTQWS